MYSIKHEEFQQAFNKSLISVFITGVIITLTHYFTLGSKAVVLLALSVVIPGLIAFWFIKTNNKIALIIYVILNLWIIIGFGVISGLFDHLFNLAGFYALNAIESVHGISSDTTNQIDTKADITGSFMFIGSLFVAKNLYRLHQIHSKLKEGN